tara:strand:- start:826 stop:1134 length:309 start_codon:yes stop_codon:yes gene_type:complete
MNFTSVYKKINNIMSSFRKKTTEKKSLIDSKPTPVKETNQTIKTSTNETVLDTELSLEESRYLLSLIAKSDFSGKDVQIVYNIAVKLQNVIKINLKEDNVNI